MLDELETTPLIFTPEDIIFESWARGDLDYKRHGGQRLLTAAARASDATMTVVHASRGYGKTFDALVDCLEQGLAHKNRRMIFAAPTREEAKKIVGAVMPFIIGDAPGEFKPVWYSSDHLYYLPSTDSELIIEGADDDQGNHLRGPHAHYVVADEAGFWRHCYYVIKSVLLPQVQRVGGKMRIQSTSPQSLGHTFVQICQEAKANNAYYLFTVHDNPRLAPEKIQRDAEEMTGKKGEEVWKTTLARREFLCEFVTEQERAVLPEFEKAVHVGEMPRMPLFRDRYDSIDLGMTDLTHCLFGYYDFDEAVVVVEDEVVKQYAPVSELAPLISAKEQELWGDHRPRRRVSDNHPMEIAEFAKQRLLQPQKVTRDLIFEPAANHNPEALINRLRTLLIAKRVKIHPRCVQLIWQCEIGIWNERRTDFERIPGAGHLDGIMALAYLVGNIDYHHNPAPRNYGAMRDTHWIPPDQRKAAPHSAAKLLPTSITGIRK